MLLVTDGQIADQNAEFLWGKILYIKLFQLISILTFSGPWIIVCSEIAVVSVFNGGIKAYIPIKSSNLWEEYSWQCKRVLC